MRLAFALLLLLPGWVAALELNDANRAQLEQLNGIGVTVAEVILQERAKARFRDWIDLSRRVKGMSGKRIEQLQKQGVTVNGVPGSLAVGAPRKDERK